MSLAEDDTAFAPPRLTLLVLFGRFLTFGLLAFGGPIAQIAMIRRRLVEQEGWMSGPRFNRLFAAMQVLPGPEAHELCVHLGIHARGRIGGLLAGLGFMLPGFLLMLAAGWAYVRYAAGLYALQGVFLAMQIAVLAVIVRAVAHLARHLLHDRLLWTLGIAALVLTVVGAPFWLVLAAAGALYGVGAGRGHAWIAVAAMATIATIATMAMTGWTPDALVSQPPADLLQRSDVATGAGGLALLWTGLKAGLLTFGGAYTAIPYMRADTVSRGWIGDGPFLDGVALAGLMPAPLIIFCTFVGYVAGGWVGAVAITAGVFLPAFAFSMIFYERLERLAEDGRLNRLLTGVAAGAAGIITATLIQLGGGVAARVTDPWPALVIFVMAVGIAFAWKSRLVTPALLAGAALAGWRVWG